MVLVSKPSYILVNFSKLGVAIVVLSAHIMLHNLGDNTYLCVMIRTQ